MSILQNALVLTARQGAFATSSISIPTPDRGQLLIKVQAAALNPVDWKVQANGIIVTDYPAILGTDIAGVVEELGDGVEGFRKGDRVLTQGYFHNTHAGFQQFTLANADVTAKIPSHLTFEQAATIPVGLGTAALGLYTQTVPPGVDFGSARLIPPWDPLGRGRYVGKPFMVLGASSSVGQYVLQLARLSGFSPIIATASLHNATHLQSLGATHVLDRQLSAFDLRTEVAKITSKPFDVIFDAVSLPATQNAAYEILAYGGCLIVVLYPRININPSTQAPGREKRVEKAFGQVNFPPENRAVGATLYRNLTALLEEGLIRPNRVETLPGGLAAAVAGLDRLRNGTVSGVKLVLRPQETT